VEVVDFKEITKIKEEEVEETEIEVEKVADQALVATDQQRGLEEISQQKDLETISPQTDIETISPRTDLEEVDIQKGSGLKISRVLKKTNQEKAVKKIIEEKATEKSQNFLVKNLKTSKIKILMQTIEKNIKIENLLIKKSI
jgi:hypothetical protein